jgi:hypothetical protein
MRNFLFFVMLIFSVIVKAQAPLQFGLANASQKINFEDSNHSVQNTVNKKWFFSTFSGITSSYNFFNGGNALVLAAPVGLQLNRQLNNNMYAFAGVSVAPAYINFNRSFLSADMNKIYPGNFNSNSFGLYSRAELGLMYVNDARTFSISGSIGVSRSSSPFLLYQQTSNPRTNSVIH